MKQDSTLTNVLGTGWHFPIHIDGRGGIALSRAAADVEESIRTILNTSRGERKMRPDFGCNIHNLIFSPNTADTAGLVKQYVREALGWWEPRIEVVDVDVHSNAAEQSRLMIDIKYRIKATNDERSLVFPFYMST